MLTTYLVNAAKPQSASGRTSRYGKTTREHEQSCSMGMVAKSSSLWSLIVRGPTFFPNELLTVPRPKLAKRLQLTKLKPDGIAVLEFTKRKTGKEKTPKDELEKKMNHLDIKFTKQEDGGEYSRMTWLLSSAGFTLQK